MCPDQRLLSAFVDGELPSPWKERIESHVHGCADCAATLMQYRRISAGLEPALFASEAASLEAARLRIAARLGLSMAPNSLQEADARPQDARPSRTVYASSFWSRPVVIPLPLAAAALVLIVFAAGLAAGFFGVSPASRQMAAMQQRLNAQTVALNDLVLSMTPNNASQLMTIQLPADASFSEVSGAPLLMTSSSGQVKTPTTLAFTEDGR